MRLNNINRILSLPNTYKNKEKVKTVSLSGIQLVSYSIRKVMSGESTENSGASLKRVVEELNIFADLSLAEKWDNVGLLIEPTVERPINNILLTNDLTEAVMKESIEKKISLVISYHPPIFIPLKKITKASWKERIVASCLENQIAVFSPHTSWDAVYGGVNDWLAEAFNPFLEEPNGKQPLIPSVNNSNATYIATIIGSPEAIDKISRNDMLLQASDRRECNGKVICTVICNEEILKKYKSFDADVNIGVVECGRSDNVKSGMGRLLRVSNLTVADCVHLIKQHTGVSHVRLACAQNQTEVSSVKTIALVPGSGGSLLKGIKADLFITGEMFHHDVLEANHNGTAVILTNHSDSERGFLSKMALLLQNIFKNDIKVEVSSIDSDPLKTV